MDTERMHSPTYLELTPMSTENYDPCFPDQPVVDRYLPVWAAQPCFRNKPAFTWAEDDSMSTRSSITYSQLNYAVDAIAANLRRLPSLNRGDTLLVLSSPGFHLLKTLFACQRAGIVTVPIIPPDPLSFSPAKQTPAHHHLLRAISQTKPKAALADPYYISAVHRSASDPLVRNLRWLSNAELERSDNTAGDARKSENCYSGCGPEETCLVQYTSGATGIPKPVIVTAGAAAHNVRAARKAYDLQPSSVIVSWLPQYHDCGLMFLLLTVVAGATCVLSSPSAFLRRPRLWLELVTEFRATCTPVPSFALPLVARRGGVESGKLPLELSCLRNLVLINEPIYRASVGVFIDEFTRVGLNSSAISPSYGLAENCTFVSTAWSCTTDGDLPSYNKLLPSARLSSLDDEEMQILVVDEETCEPAEDGVEGEIWVSSPSNATGYLGHPSMTREVFYGRLKGMTGKRFVRTGDVGVVRGKERYLYVAGRTSEVIAAHGRRVHSHYLETAAYKSNPGMLRGGCIAAFGIGLSASTEVAVVAELQQRNEGNVAYRRTCERIREAVWREEGVRVGLVALVESGSVAKTTSGKLRRWMVKDVLLRGRLPVVFKEWSVEAQAGMVREEKVGGGSAASAEGTGGEEVSVMAFGDASQRQSLHSFL